MILFRVCQGFTGGVLIQLSFVVIPYLPSGVQRRDWYGHVHRHGNLRPCRSPLLGGWLTDNYGWPFVFYININVITGLLLIAVVWFTMEQQPMNLSLLKKGDWWGIATMVIGLAA